MFATVVPSAYEGLLKQVESSWGSGHSQAKIVEELRNDLKKFRPTGDTSPVLKFKWENYSTFWPPRALEAVKNNRLICFFGAGLSIPSGLASWSDLLNTYFGLNAIYTEDKDLQNDPLTLAEIAAHQLGAEQLQNVLRASLSRVERPSVTHLLASALRLPFYLTTNYDNLFERAWPLVNGGQIELKSVVNSADLGDFLSASGGLEPKADVSYLIKLHGCISRDTEHLILTRSDYRRHYRDNSDFFHEVRRLLMQYHTLFLGFSHTDPEVTRLVEDAIWEYEHQGRHRSPSTIDKPSEERGPTIYSLQYGMGSHTPEIFAARGIVALRPSVTAAASDPRTAAVSRSLSDLLWAAQDYRAEYNLDPLLKDAVSDIETPLQKALNRLGRFKDQAIAGLAGDLTETWMQEIVHDPDSLAFQGVYLTDAVGRLIGCEVPKGLDKTSRVNARSLFGDRPYFRQANTFRKPFVSDSVSSAFNNNSTFMLCVPITQHGGFRGLLFAACQIGSWAAPIEVAKRIWKQGCLFVLVDSNGICLIPPKDEFEPTNADVLGETPQSNIGYLYGELLGISRRDRLVARVMENVIPLQQDDDVLPLGTDLAYYTIMSELQVARWKLGISLPIKLGAT